MASNASTPRSRSRSSTSSSAASDTTMLYAPLSTPVRRRPASHHGNTPTSEQASTSDPSFFRLLSLPRELRDRIYTHALVSPYPFWWPGPASPNHNIAAGLLSTSRQVHDEAVVVLYTQNKFLFTHPSDCNMFRTVASPYAENITSVFLRIRERDVKLWTTYLGSTSAERSLKADLPKLKSLWVFLRAGTMGSPAMIAQLSEQSHGDAGDVALPAGLAAQVHALQQPMPGHANALQTQVQHHIASLQQQVHVALFHPYAPTHVQVAPQLYAQHGNTQAMPVTHFTATLAYPHPLPTPPQAHLHGIHNNPPPHPSPLAQLTWHGNTLGNPPPRMRPGLHPHTFYAACLRWEREMGLEALCLSLRETKPVDADIRIVCIMKIPKDEVQRLARSYMDELMLDRHGDARTTFRKVHGLSVCLELSGYELTS